MCSIQVASRSRRFLSLLIMMIVPFVACQAVPDPEQAPQLASAIRGAWNLERLGDAQVPELGSVFIVFEEQGRVHGCAGLNQVQGSWRLQEGVLTIGPLASTMMAGPPELMEQESKFLYALQSAQGAQIDKQGKLSLLSSDGTQLACAARRELSE